MTEKTLSFNLFEKIIWFNWEEKSSGNRTTRYFWTHYKTAFLWHIWSCQRSWISPSIDRLGLSKWKIFACIPYIFFQARALPETMLCHYTPPSSQAQNFVFILASFVTASWYKRASLKTLDWFCRVFFYSQMFLTAKAWRLDTDLSLDTSQL